MSREFRDKLARVQDLMRHSNPRGELAPIFERALDLLVADLEKTRLAKTDRPRRAKQAKHGAISRAARREVFERDGERCTYVAPSGRRCAARAFIQLDHDVARARGGSGAPENLRVRCGAHNRFAAKQLFGEQYVDDKIAARRAQSRAGARDVYDGEDREVHAAEDRDTCAEERRDACGAERRDTHAAEDRDTCAGGRGACAAESRDVRGAEDRDACTAESRDVHVARDHEVRVAAGREVPAALGRDACGAELGAPGVAARERTTGEHMSGVAATARSACDNDLRHQCQWTAVGDSSGIAPTHDDCATVGSGSAHGANDANLRQRRSIGDSGVAEAPTPDACGAVGPAPTHGANDASLCQRRSVGESGVVEAPTPDDCGTVGPAAAHGANDANLCQRRSIGDSGSSENAGTRSLGDDTQAKLVRGLTNMGFRERVARRAVAELAARQMSASHVSERSEHSLPALFRAALALLIP